MKTATDTAARQEVLKRALLQLKDLQGKVAEAERLRTEPIAIVGLGCRFPGGAANPESFWQLLRGGRDAIVEVPPDRWDAEAYFDADPAAAGKMYTRWGGFLTEPVDLFDADFFGIKPREAATLDPQQRLLLEVGWEALEHAGQGPDRLKGSETGVFVGISANDYAQRTLFADPGKIDLYSATGNALNAAAGRLAYFLGLQGPALVVDTACSSSLVAVHLACASLRNQECRLALAGGVNLMLTPHGTIATCRARMMAPDGRCKTFDAAADGYVRSEGCGLVVLKRLADAVADRDHIWAILRGSAINQDGASSALTVPNGVAQQELLRKALNNAQVAPSAISYLEAHGTGTSLGDPIEVDSIQAVLREGRAPDRPCAIGSVKTNLGHLEAAAGIAGLIKVVLALHHQEIPAHLHLKNLNPHITLDETRFAIPTASQPWRTGNEPRRAGVSSFGFTGTNAHVVVEEAPVLQGRDPEGMESGTADRPVHLLTLSARNEKALQELAGRHLAGCRAGGNGMLGDIAFTANVGRAHFPHRLAVVAGSPTQLEAALSAFIQGRTAPGLVREPMPAGEVPRVAFFFPSQVPEHVHGGRQLLETQPTFRRALERCEELLRPHLPMPLLSVLYPEKGTSPPATDAVCAQAALFALEYALAQLWLSWGIEPTAVVGEGVGEYVAACVAGVFNLEDGLRLAVQRARLLPSNGQPGPERDEFQRLAAAIQYSPPRFRIIGCSSGQVVDAKALTTAAYWRSPLPQTPCAAQTWQTLNDLACNLVLAMGCNSPTARLTTPAWLSSLDEQANDLEQVLGCLARLYVRGVKVDWARFDRAYPRRRVPLPTYPFQPVRHWTEANDRASPGRGSLRKVAHPYLGSRISSPLAALQYETQFSLRRLPLVRDHQIHGMNWVNLVIYLEMAMSGARDAFGDKPRTLQNVTIPQGLVLRTEDQRDVQLILTPNQPGSATFQVLSRKPGLEAAAQSGEPASAWTLHVTGEIAEKADESLLARPAPFHLEEIRGRCTEEITRDQFYGRMPSQGIQLGPTSRWVEQVWRRDGEALARLRMPQTAEEDDSGYSLPLHGIDACFQVIVAPIPGERCDYLLHDLGTLRCWSRPIGKPLWCHAEVVRTGAQNDTVVANLRLMEESGEVVAELLETTVQRINPEMLRLKAQSAHGPRKRLGQERFLHAFQTAAPDQRREKLVAYLTQMLAEALQVEPDGVDTEAPLLAQVDSLIAVELKQQVEADLQGEVPLAVFFDGSNLKGLAAALLEQLSLKGLSAAEAALEEPEAVAQILAELEELSESEAQALLVGGANVSRTPVAQEVGNE